MLCVGYRNIKFKKSQKVFMSRRPSTNQLTLDVVPLSLLLLILIYRNNKTHKQTRAKMKWKQKRTNISSHPLPFKIIYTNFVRILKLQNVCANTKPQYWFVLILNGKEGLTGRGLHGSVLFLFSRSIQYSWLFLFSHLYIVLI